MRSRKRNRSTWFSIVIWEMWNRTLSSAGRSADGGGGIIVSTRSSPSRSWRSDSCARDWSSCSYCAGAAITGTAEEERRGMRRRIEGRLSVIKWSHHILSKTQLSCLRTSEMLLWEFHGDPRSCGKWANDFHFLNLTVHILNLGKYLLHNTCYLS